MPATVYHQNTFKHLFPLLPQKTCLSKIEMGSQASLSFTQAVSIKSTEECTVQQMKNHHHFCNCALQYRNHIHMKDSLNEEQKLY